MNGNTIVPKGFSSAGFGFKCLCSRRGCMNDCHCTPVFLCRSLKPAVKHLVQGRSLGSQLSFRWRSKPRGGLEVSQEQQWRVFWGACDWMGRDWTGVWISHVTIISLFFFFYAPTAGFWLAKINPSIAAVDRKISHSHKWQILERL